MTMTPAVRRLHHELGLHIVPMRTTDTGQKKPAIRWRRGGVDYVETKPLDADIEAWSTSPDQAWAILCGGPSKVVCLDVEAAGMDDPAITGVLEKFPESCQRPSPSGGRHAWAQIISEGELPATQALARKADKTMLAEIRGHGAYAVVLGMGRGLELPKGWAPAPMTRDAFDQLTAPIRAVNEYTEPEPKHAPRGRGLRLGSFPTDTGEALFAAVAEDPLVILELLDDGWTANGFDYAGRLQLLRPDYGDPTDAEASANVLDGRFICWSTAVPWAKAKPGTAYTPGDVLAKARYGGDYGAAMRAVEEASHAAHQ